MQRFPGTEKSLGYRQTRCPAAEPFYWKPHIGLYLTAVQHICTFAHLHMCIFAFPAPLCCASFASHTILICPSLFGLVQTSDLIEFYYKKRIILVALATLCVLGCFFFFARIISDLPFWFPADRQRRRSMIRLLYISLAFCPAAVQPRPDRRRQTAMASVYAHLPHRNGNDFP